MKYNCLSLWQPWASLVVHGHKKVETRYWATRARGPLLIHAAKVWNASTCAIARQSPFLELLDPGRELIWNDEVCPLPVGAIVGQAHLDDCVPTEQFVPHSQGVVPGAIGDPRLILTRQEAAFGDFRAGRLGWLLSRPRWLAEPVPYRGRPGVFQVREPEALDLLRRCLP